MTTVVEALNSPGKRARVQDAQIVTKLPSSAKSLISDIAKKEGVSEATVVRQALAEYFERRGYRG